MTPTTSHSQNVFKERPLCDALGVAGGIVCAAGAGGKKSLLYALAREARGRVALTTTVHIAQPPDDLNAQRIIDAPAALLERVPKEAGAGITFFACPSHKTDRFSGLDPAALAALLHTTRFDLVLVKADGARGRGIKAPREGEPVLPPGCARVLAVISAAVLDQPLDALNAHRHERLAEVVGAQPGDRLDTAHLLRLMTSPEGSLQGIGDAAITVVINQVDNAGIAQRLGPVAEAALESCPRIDRVVLTCLRGAPRVIAGFSRKHLV